MSEENTYYLYPGNIFTHVEPHMVTTVLGSCVSVCLFDPSNKWGGINHYLLPLWNGEGLASPKYGNIAIPKLIEKLEGYGSDRRRLVAKVFGGGEVLRVSSGILNVGQRNIMIAMDMLEELRIKVDVANVGGPQGRKIIYDTGTGQVLMKKLKRIDEGSSMRRQDGQITQVDIKPIKPIRI